MAEKKAPKRKGSNRKKRVGWLRAKTLILTLLILLIVYIVGGFWHIKGMTLLERTDKLLDMKILQPSHNKLMRTLGAWEKEGKESVGDWKRQVEDSLAEEPADASRKDARQAGEADAVRNTAKPDKSDESKSEAKSGNDTPIKPKSDKPLDQTTPKDRKDLDKLMEKL